MSKVEGRRIGTEAIVGARVGSETLPVPDAPETRYASSGGAEIAYQVVGSGPLDLIVFTTAQTPIDLVWESPSAARFFHRLASFSRLILFDVAGVGSSDHVDFGSGGVAERWADDAVAVLDAVGSTRAAVLGIAETGVPAIVFAATYPQLTSALLLLNSLARFLQADDCPFGLPEELALTIGARIIQRWGTGESAGRVAPSLANDRVFARMWGRWERLGVRPRDWPTMWHIVERFDVRDVLPAVRVPTLVLHRAQDPYIRIDHGRYLASRIPDARLVELSGADHIFFVGDVEPMLEEIEEFLTGARGSPSADRVLATVMFTDIVGSTEAAARHGDRAWAEILDEHDDIVARRIERYRGRQIKTTGDGVLATFDGPARAIHCACSLREEARSLGLEMRAGLHTGEVELRGEDVGGISVHTAARVVAQAEAGEVLVSRIVTDLVAGSGVAFEACGEFELKGVPGTWGLFRVMA
jgi:class 3 adenylate cyclase